jgi:hypothetical protein
MDGRMVGLLAWPHIAILGPIDLKLGGDHQVDLLFLLLHVFKSLFQHSSSNEVKTWK